MTPIEQVFLKIVSMSLGASLVTAFVLILRFGMKKLPKIYSYFLWLIVFLRFLCPVTIQTVLGLIPIKTDAITYQGLTGSTPYVETGIGRLDVTLANTVSASSGPTPTASVDPMQIYIWAGAWLWAFGVGIVLIYSIMSLVRLKQKVGMATLIADGVFETDQIKTPFLLGIIRPRIYIPTGLTAQERAYVVLHEKAHLKGKDQMIKPLAFLAVALHWFNPFAWLSFYLMTKDMEMSVDEAVVRGAKEDIRAGYSRSLLSLSMKQNGLFVPLAFGKSSTKERVKNVLNFKRPAAWVCIAATVIIIAAAAVLLTTNPTDNAKGDPTADQNGQTTGIIQEQDRLKALCDNRTLYIGNNSKVAALVVSLPAPDELLTYSGIELQTDQKPYELKINYTLAPGKTFADMDKTYTDVNFSNMALLFAAIENMDTCSINITSNDGNTSGIVTEREEAERPFGGSLYAYSESPEKLKVLNSKIADYVDFLNDLRSDTLKSTDKNTISAN